MKSLAQMACFLLCFVFGFLLLGCGRNVEVVYKFDIFGFADTASAYRNGELIATAVKKEMSRTGADILDVEVLETHFSKDGSVIYEGKMVFRYKTGTGRGERVEVDPITGRRPRDLFRKWPYGTSMPMGFGH